MIKEKNNLIMKRFSLVFKKQGNQKNPNLFSIVDFVAINLNLCIASKENYS